MPQVAKLIHQYLIIDRSNGDEFFKSNEPSHFQSSNIDIKSKQMHYDATIKKTRINGKGFCYL